MTNEVSSIEVWKDIPDYEGLYQASNLGRVKTISRESSCGRNLPEKIMKLNKKSHGYLHIGLTRKGCRQKTYRVHRLVLSAFIGKCELHIDHINSVKDDNRLCNLEYATVRENNTRAGQLRRKYCLPVGVYLQKGRYVSKIRLRGKSYHLGCYSTPDEASSAYQLKLKEFQE